MLEKLHNFLFEEVKRLSQYFERDFTELVDGKQKVHVKRINEEDVKKALEKALQTGFKEDIREAVELRGWYDYQDGKRSQAQKSLREFWKIVNTFTA